ncbi:FMN-dependent NADH-azoreductase [Oceanimonas sp. CAM02]|uniref:FMN-dependent NADH-azoreductase n=1 Tax=Oceanimonas sp. CAM02 TaxID=3080336 RepID=UPI0029357587|nr:FMN-dependent NADH-azoreductase [Oceanimonas sp. CAM02]MDV2856952.1 FMN-dependent NADH-azoreductase [Oceanimonas sp. CAM02]
MSKTLILKSSILGDYSASGMLTDYFAARLDEPGIKIRDLADAPLPMLDGDGAMALRGGEHLNEQQQALLALSDELVNELKEAERIVIAAPMYNFHVPVQLKAWIDLVCRAGVTFRYTDKGAQGLLENKMAIVITTRGGLHKDTAHDMITPYMRTILGFLGITEVEFVYAEAMGMAEELREQQLDDAKKQLTRLAKG